MDNETMNLGQFAAPVHQSLMEKNVLFGIGSMPFYIIIMVTILLCSMVSVFCIFVGLLAFFICRLICKKEPMLLEFIIQNLNVKDVYRG